MSSAGSVHAVPSRNRTMTHWPRTKPSEPRPVKTWIDESIIDPRYLPPPCQAPGCEERLPLKSKRKTCSDRCSGLLSEATRQANRRAAQAEGSGG